MKTKWFHTCGVLLAAAFIPAQTPAQTASAARRPVPTPVEYEPIGGVSNNLYNIHWGCTGYDLLRLAPAAYADGISAMGLPNDLSARLISDFVNNQADPANPSQDIQTVDQNSLSDFGYSFGQFMDHDLDLTLDNGTSVPILVPPGDPIGGSNDTPLAFQRSLPDPLTGTSTANPAEDINAICSYFDLSQIYGSDLATADALRTFSGGLMKTSPGGLPPLNNTNYFTDEQLVAVNASVGGMANSGGAPQTDIYVTGDSRGNENVELTVLQALFLDNHNLIAGEMQRANPNWSDEQLYQEARKLNIAEYQNVIYSEWIPAVMGARALPSYTGYKTNVNAGISTEFSTVAFRFGHSLLSGNVERQGNNGLELSASVPLALDFFDPYILNGRGQASGTDPLTGLPSTDIGAVLKGDADGNAQANDVLAINEVRDLLFNETIPGVGAGQDLIALDVQRGRDHGIPDYNTLRTSFGLPALTSFAQITANVQVQKELKAAYPGGVHTIDAFEGGLAEDHARGSDLGSLFQLIMADQFTRSRDGDRFFYLNENFTTQESQILQRESSLAQIIMANTEITNLQADVMLFQASISGTISMVSARRPNSWSQKGVAGISVQLEDTTGDVLAVTKTDSHGDYSFNQLSGPSANPAIAPGVSATGWYKVVPVLPAGSAITAAGARSNNVLISRGDTAVNNVNFVIGSPRPASGGH